MRINHFDLTRYGHFTDKRLSLPKTGPQDLHIIYGPNEAGKSTLFNAWLDFLFGIGMRSKYDFLHNGPVMQIGAELSHEGRTFDLKRLKRRTSSLLDQNDRAFPETDLQAMLGGLSRDSYSAMFSLDDATIESGGDTILASKGDLGQMLFQASAGLTRLSPKLDKIRADLDAFYRPQKRSGGLLDAKKALEDLDRQRRENDVNLSTLQRLTRAVQTSHAQWEQARLRSEQAQEQIDSLQDILAVMPLWEQKLRLEAQIAPLAHLPNITALQLADYEGYEQNQRDITARRQARQLRVAALEDQLKDLALDPVILDYSEMIQVGEELRPEHDSAQKDLPRRIDSADELKRQIQTLLFELQHPEAKAQDLCLAPVLLSSLRRMLADRSGLASAADNASREYQSAQQNLDEKRKLLASDLDLSPQTQDDALEPLLTHLRQNDPQTALIQAQKTYDLYAIQAANALSNLGPWTGTGDQLTTLCVPNAPKRKQWQQDYEQSRQGLSDCARDLAALSDERERLIQEKGTQTAAQTLQELSLAQAAQLRGKREALWSQHLRDMSLPTAQAFELALREDDRVSALMAQTLADAKRDAQYQARENSLNARINACQARQMAHEQQQDQILRELSPVLIVLGFSLTDQPLGQLLAQLDHWSALRDQALTALEQAEISSAVLDQAKAALAQAQHSLSQILPAQPSADYTTLLATAQARLTNKQRRQDARHHLAQLEIEAEKRKSSYAQAQSALLAWQETWKTNCQSTILRDYDDQNPDLVSVLERLDHLYQKVQELSALDDRIQKMQANQANFQKVKADISAGLNISAQLPWSDILTRLRRAQDNSRDTDLLRGQMASEHQDDANDQREMLALEAQINALALTLDWRAEYAPLPDYLALCKQTTSLRQALKDLLDELEKHPQPTADQDPDALRTQLSSLKAEQPILRDATEQALRQYLGAKNEYDAVNGDETLAKLTAERENLLLDLKDQANRHLIERLGLMAFDAALRRYRDQHRSSMLTRAAQAFDTLSCGAYPSLSTQPNGDEEILVANSRTGATKLAADLSKGTRFQLYLALRIAGYYELAQSRPSVPFIADDIMETFDDQRAKAAFEILGAMSHQGQVIYLTHHQHLCQLAKQVYPNVNIIELA